MPVAEPPVIDDGSTQARAIALRVLARARSLTRPPTRLEFSARCKLVGGELKGHAYNADSDPIQRWLIEQMDLGIWERIFWCAPPQFGGKTVVGILMPALYGTIVQRLPIGYALPTLQDLDKAWHTKLRPQLLASGFGDHLPVHGPGSKGGRGPSVQLRDPETGELEGHILFCAGGAYGDTTAGMLIDEADQFRKNDEPDVEALEDLFNRCNAYRSRALRVVVGTIEWDDNSTILALVDQGTGSRPWLRCPHCGRHQAIDPIKQLVYDGDDDTTVRASARLICATCAARWTEDDRQQAIRDLIMVHRGQTVTERGEIDGPTPRTIALSLIYSAFDCPHARLPELAREHWHAARAEAKGNYPLMRKFTRYRLVRPYEQPVVAGEISNRALADLSKRSDYHQREVPAWVRRLVVACDVQKTRHYWLALGHGDDDRWCIIDWGYEFLVELDAHGHPLREPNHDDRVRVMDLIDAKVMTGWPRQGQPDDRVVPVSCGIDTGYLAGEIVEWVASKPHWCAMKGVGRDQAGRKDDQRLDGKSLLEPVLAERLLGVCRVTQPTTMTIPLWLVAGSNVRQQFHSGLMRAPRSPGSGMLPLDLAANDNLLLHLTAEIWTKDPKTGKWYWREARADRNHLLDCGTQALALAQYEAAVADLYPPEPPAPKPPPADARDHDHPASFAQPSTTPDGRPWLVSDR
jgi:phage terminase large subunit GpA-like protein